MTEVQYLTRDQIAKFADTPQAIRAFENMFKAVGTTLPAQVQQAQDNANEALTLIVGINNQIIIINNAIATLNSDIANIQADITTIQADQASQATDITNLQNDLAALTLIVNALNALAIKFVGAATLFASTVSLTNYSAALGATLTNSPVAGNPTKWVRIDDNGTMRYLPLW